MQLVCVTFGHLVVVVEIIWEMTSFGRDVAYPKKPSGQAPELPT